MHIIQIVLSKGFATISLTAISTAFPIMTFFYFKARAKNKIFVKQTEFENFKELNDAKCQNTNNIIDEIRTNVEKIENSVSNYEQIMDDKHERLRGELKKDMISYINLLKK